MRSKKATRINSSASEVFDRKVMFYSRFDKIYASQVSGSKNKLLELVGLVYGGK